jgi:hypothetical protein
MGSNAADLVRRRVAVIAALGGAPAAAVRAETATIPIVFGVTEDPVRFGLVDSLARPGGNAAGVNYLSREVDAKRLALLHELVPKAVRVALLLNPSTPKYPSLPTSVLHETTLQQVQEAAPRDRTATTGPLRQHKPRDRCGLRNFWTRTTRRAFRPRRQLIFQPACPTCHLGGARSDSNSLCLA